MENQVVKDLPLYINGFAVTYLFMGTEKTVDRLFADFLKTRERSAAPAQAGTGSRGTTESRPGF